MKDATDSIRAAVSAPVAAPDLVQVVIPKPSVAPVADPAWSRALERYASPRALRTRARGRPFTVATGNDHLVITPETGRPRRVFAAEFLRVAQLLGAGSRELLLTVTFNASYLEAVIDDLESAGQTLRERA